MNLAGVRAGSKCLNTFQRTRVGFVIQDGKGGSIVSAQPQVPIPYLRTLLYDAGGQPIIAETGNPEEGEPPGFDSLVISGGCGLLWRYRGRAGYRQRLVWDGCKWVTENDNFKELDDYDSVSDGTDDCKYKPLVLIEQADGSFQIGYRNTHYRTPGEIIAYGGATSTVPPDFLLCNGSSYDTTEYPDLYAVLGFKWGNDSGKFRVPDLRGYFLRGVDHSQGVDVDAGSRTAKYTGGNTGDKVGTYETDTFQCHEHNIPINSGLAGSAEQVSSITSRAEKALGTVETDSIRESDCDAPRTSDETRPKNASVEYIIYAGCKEGT